MTATTPATTVRASTGSLLLSDPSPVDAQERNRSDSGRDQEQLPEFCLHPDAQLQTGHEVGEADVEKTDPPTNPEAALNLGRCWKPT